MDRPDHTINLWTNINGLKKVMVLTVMVTIGLILFSFEVYLPGPIPGGRIGLSQLVTLLALVWFGWREALLVVTLRVITGNLILGTMFNPVFLLGLSGAFVSLAAMALVYCNTKKLSIIGISVIGALTHNITQLFMAHLLFIKSKEIFWLVPYFIWASLFSGLLIGTAAWYVAGRLLVNRA